MTSIQVVWETTVIETHKRTVELDELPDAVREAWLDGQILVTEGCSADAAHEELIDWICEVEETPYSDAVTDRVVTETNALVSRLCATCGWETPDYTSARVAEAALENHVRTTHA